MVVVVLDCVAVSTSLAVLDVVVEVSVSCDSVMGTSVDVVS